jgi:hypothetical protein
MPTTKFTLCATRIRSGASSAGRSVGVRLRFEVVGFADQLDLQAIDRVRDRLISRRTAVINQLRAFLLERGLVFAKAPAKLRAALPDILENANLDLTPQNAERDRSSLERVEDSRGPD